MCGRDNGEAAAFAGSWTFCGSLAVETPQRSFLGCMYTAAAALGSVRCRCETCGNRCPAFFSASSHLSGVRTLQRLLFTVFLGCISSEFAFFSGVRSPQSCFQLEMGCIYTANSLALCEDLVWGSVGCTYTRGCFVNQFVIPYKANVFFSNLCRRTRHWSV